jgi:hypothetical protein
MDYLFLLELELKPLLPEPLPCRMSTLLNLSFACFPSLGQMKQRVNTLASLITGSFGPLVWLGSMRLSLTCMPSQKVAGRSTQCVALWLPVLNVGC